MASRLPRNDFEKRVPSYPRENANIGEVWKKERARGASKHLEKTTNAIGNHSSFKFNPTSRKPPLNNSKSTTLIITKIQIAFLFEEQFLFLKNVSEHYLHPRDQISRLLGRSVSFVLFNAEASPPHRTNQQLYPQRDLDLSPSTNNTIPLYNNLHTSNPSKWPAKDSAPSSNI
jgi:hypothetical protein